jgi:hypothetical protein
VCAQDTLGACGGCYEPTDVLYGTAGVPNYMDGGCVGCDGTRPPTRLAPFDALTR